MAAAKWPPPSISTAQCLCDGRRSISRSISSSVSGAFCKKRATEPRPFEEFPTNSKRKKGEHFFGVQQAAVDGHAQAVGVFEGDFRVARAAALRPAAVLLVVATARARNARNAVVVASALEAVELVGADHRSVVKLLLKHKITQCML